MLGIGAVLMIGAAQVDPCLPAISRRQDDVKVFIRALSIRPQRSASFILQSAHSQFVCFGHSIARMIWNAVSQIGPPDEHAFRLTKPFRLPSPRNCAPQVRIRRFLSSCPIDVLLPSAEIKSDCTSQGGLADDGCPNPSGRRVSRPCCPDPGSC